MKGEVLFVAHCLLNPWTKTEPQPPQTDVVRPLCEAALRRGTGLVQLPCPELLWGGPLRWGVTKEQLVASAAPDMWRRAAQDFFAPWWRFCRAGGAVLGLLGVKGSPSCGVSTTCCGYCGGEIGALGAKPQQARACAGAGLWTELCLALWREQGLDLPAYEVDEAAGEAALEALLCRVFEGGDSLGRA